jgi:hypothetical protein
MNKMVKQIEVNGEKIIAGGNGALVASKSEPGGWHVVQRGRCDCKGYQYRGQCRHLVALKTWLTPTPVPDRDIAPLSMGLGTDASGLFAVTAHRIVVDPASLTFAALFGEEPF